MLRLMAVLVLVGCGAGEPCGTEARCETGEYCVVAGHPEGFCLSEPSCFEGVDCGSPDAGCLIVPAIEAGATCGVDDIMVCVGVNDGSDGGDVVDVPFITCTNN